MPCRDGPNCEFGAQHVDRAFKDRLDKVTALLCDVLQRIENSVKGDQPAEFLSPAVEDWWREHKREDARRRKREEENAKQRLATG